MKYMTPNLFAKDMFRVPEHAKMGMQGCGTEAGVKVKG